MRTLIVYDSTYGNTAQIARRIATELHAAGPVRTAPVVEGGALDLRDVELLVVGGPTQRHGISPALRGALDALPRHALDGVAVATFDTRYHQAAWLTGSAASGIARLLKRSGARLIRPPESFIMEQDRPPEGQKRRHELERLMPGELERAGAWAAALLAALPATPTTVVP